MSRTVTRAHTRERALPARQVTLLDLLDRLLGGGVVVNGQIMLAAADIDLVEVDLGLLVGSVDKVRGAAGSEERQPAIEGTASGGRAAGSLARQPRAGEPHRSAGPRPLPPIHRRRKRARPGGREPTRPASRSPGRVDADPERLERGLAQLVLTLVELLRQLMERQALRRIDGGTLTAEEIERLGRTFMALSERMEELKETFGLSDEDLNMNLGPLGDLM